MADSPWQNLWSGIKPATDEIQGICSVLKSYVEDKTKKTYREFRAIEYSEQLEGERNNAVRVYVAEEKLIDLMVCLLAPNNIPNGSWKVAFELKEVLQNRTLDDPLPPPQKLN
ncbi:cystatin-A1-like [Fundulus heteroclitus]|uniref:cystatin-A1-like n=1 Tax=Fundulus heteroclitus TaxID=8078 RepID=UPI00165CCD76|nr:cystatin-A1-like [Fundulus heteroclitus]